MKKEQELCQCETWGGDRGCIECVEKENIEEPTESELREELEYGSV